MTIDERVESGVIVIRVTGRLTLTEGTAALDDKLRRLVDTDHDQLILELAEVPYIDSSAVGILLRTHATLSRRGGALRLLRAHAHIRELLEKTRLSTVLEVFDSEAAALRSLATLRTPGA